MNEEIKEILKDDDELVVVYKDNSTRIFDSLTIDVLNHITNLQQENEEKDKEIERLNNILNEFEEWLIEESKEVIRDAGYHQRIMLDVLNKLKELKEKE